MDNSVILKFINNFKDCQYTFLNGCCYWFAKILYDRFKSRIMYLPVENHFIGEYCDRLYDVTGDVTDLYANSTMYDWESYMWIDDKHYKRLYRQCVLKLDDLGDGDN